MRISIIKKITSSTQFFLSIKFNKTVQKNDPFKNYDLKSKWNILIDNNSSSENLKLFRHKKFGEVPYHKAYE
jgi:hypothetical protein